MTELRKNLPDLPRHMRHLPIDERGYPVPWFVAWFDGKPDFRVVAENKWIEAVTRNLCFICGDRLGRYLAFPIGPMSSVNRISSEPPAHRECAIFAAQACPFLALPKAQRRETNTPPRVHEAPGVMLPHNPGLALVWITHGYKIMRVSNGHLIALGDPHEVLWFYEGRAATRAEIIEAFVRGQGALRELSEREGIDSERAFQRKLAAAYQLIPKE